MLLLVDEGVDSIISPSAVLPLGLGNPLQRTRGTLQNSEGGGKNDGGEKKEAAKISSFPLLPAGVSAGSNIVLFVEEPSLDPRQIAFKLIIVLVF